VKVLRRSLTAAVATDRFRREISLASALAHPHLLPILDSGESDGLLWYAMPHVAGGSLRTRITRDGALPLRDAVRIARDVASALATVHDAGIVHRDVKPANVLLDDDVALLADFGVARVLSAGGTQLRSELTATGAQIGTPLYMSPEQGRGDDLVDARSDLYGLGATLFEMVTGTRAYAGTPAAAWPDLRTLVPVPSARRLRPDVPASLERLLEWMLAVDRDARPPNAIAVVAALDGAAADRGIVAP
jgi:serine/threonine-protein kinase